MKILACSKGQLNYPFIINSSTILFCWLFTWIFIKKYKYSFLHILGILLSVTGVIVTFYGALQIGEDIIKEIRENYLYFIFSLVSSICYSISTVLMEANFESGKDIYDFFLWQGLLGALCLFVESFAFSEPQNLIRLFKSTKIDYLFLLFLLLFIVLLSIFDLIMPFYIKRHSASLFNISLVSQIFWAFVVEAIKTQGPANNYWYYLGFFIILSGIIIFSLVNAEINEKHHSKVEPEVTISYKGDCSGSLIPANMKDNTTEQVEDDNQYMVNMNKRASVYRTRQVADKYVIDKAT